MKEKKDVLVIAFSSGLSGTYNSYCIAANELNEEYENKVRILNQVFAHIDTESLYPVSEKISVVREMLSDISIFRTSPDMLIKILAGTEG